MATLKSPNITSAGAGTNHMAYPLGEEPVWRQLGLASDPNKQYDFCVTAKVLAGSLSALTKPFTAHFYYLRGG